MKKQLVAIFDSSIDKLFTIWIGSLIINHTSLKIEGYTSRTGAYIIWGYLTGGIYILVASICNLFFDPNKERNIGYKKD